MTLVQNTFRTLLTVALVAGLFVSLGASAYAYDGYQLFGGSSIGAGEWGRGGGYSHGGYDQGGYASDSYNDHSYNTRYTYKFYDDAYITPGRPHYVCGWDCDDKRDRDSRDYWNGYRNDNGRNGYQSDWYYNYNPYWGY